MSNYAMTLFLQRLTIKKNIVFCNKPLLKLTRLVEVVKKEAVNPVGPKRSIIPLSSD